MTNRRQFIQSSLALSAAGVPAVRALASSASAMAGVPTLHRFERFIYDGRFLECEDVAFAAADGETAVRIEGDLTALWYHDLGPAWKRAPMTIAGITAWHGLFVLETLAADHGMRVVYRGEHKISSFTGRPSHALSAPAAMLEPLKSSDGSFWTRLGRAMTQCPSGPDVSTARVILNGLEKAESTAELTEPLYSWIIAPRVPRSPGRGGPRRTAR